MSDILIKVGSVSKNPAHYQDGDVVSAMNGRRIRMAFADNICHWKMNTLNQWGLLPGNSMTFKYYELTSKYRFDRVSFKEITRINLITGVIDLLSDTPNESGEYIHVSKFLETRREAPDNSIFGKFGEEIWFGERYKRVTNLDYSKVWQMIETKSARRELDHMSWPFSKHEKRDFLVIRSDAMSDAFANDLVQPEFIDTPEGKKVKRNRKKFINWEALGVGTNKGRVRNKRIEVDVRKLKIHKSSEIAIIRV